MPADSLPDFPVIARFGIRRRRRDGNGAHPEPGPRAA